jgi:hypothetical protein
MSKTGLGGLFFALSENSRAPILVPEVAEGLKAATNICMTTIKGQKFSNLLLAVASM